MAIDNKRIGVIYSSHSGSSYASHKRWDMIRRYMEQKGVAYDFVQSESFGSVERLAAMLCDNGYHTIVVVGGDGALNDAINAIMTKHDILPDDFALGTIPNGVGNDFARFWSISADEYKEAVDRIIERHLRKVDVGTIDYQYNGTEQRRYFIDCVNLGLGARLIKVTSDFVHLIGSRRLSVIPVLISHLFERKSFDIELKIDTETIKGTYMSVSIGNCLSYGQTPNAVPYNGMVDISLITRPKWWQMFEGFWLLGKGRFLNFTNVHPYRAQNITITEMDKALLTLDGRIPLQGKDITPIKIGVMKEVVNFII